MTEDDFNLFQWSNAIPLCDDLWLGMQARNIGIVDISMLRSIEADALAAYMERERTPTDILLPLAALSQMWIFSVYEFLRTWRQRAKELVEAHEKMKSLAIEEQQAFADELLQKAKHRERLIRLAPSWLAEHSGRIADATFVDGVRAYWNKTDALFKEIEALRVTLAKHEIPKTKGLAAEAPGYGRMSYTTGSMYWFITLRDNSQFKVDRREVADELFGFHERNPGDLTLDDILKAPRTRNAEP